jgi:hypothetical protein
MPAEGPRPSPAVRPAPTAIGPAPAGPKQRPDPRPMRLAIAAVSIMSAGLVRFPAPSGDAIAADGAAAVSIEILATARPEVIVKHKVRYVQLKPGERAPKGAKVISGAVPTPRVVVTRVAGHAAQTRRVVVHKVVTRTRQSGH